MFFSTLFEYCPEVAEKETRSVTIGLLSTYKLPRQEYGLVESYCTDPDCDCRRVLFNVVTPKSSSVLAVVTYGWEPESFYQTWAGTTDQDQIQQLKGPALADGSPQSNLAPELLNLIKTMLRRDVTYRQRLQHHYALFKRAVREAEDPASSD
jgi:hypothetical protein